MTQTHTDHELRFDCFGEASYRGWRVVKCTMTPDNVNPTTLMTAAVVGRGEALPVGYFIISPDGRSSMRACDYLVLLAHIDFVCAAKRETSG